MSSKIFHRLIDQQIVELTYRCHMGGCILYGQLTRIYVAVDQLRQLEKSQWTN